MRPEAYEVTQILRVQDVWPADVRVEATARSPRGTTVVANGCSVYSYCFHDSFSSLKMRNYLLLLSPFHRWGKMRPREDLLALGAILMYEV